ncbi:DUF402 domain-containing protein [Paenibacillus yanchengensis]|uniref:DUF402 domain-containing protein n=1 Tax=Paenibacillus yanchengensis TaxID=2035833 RepID=A0ABW4YEW1_9BACL
MDRQYGAEVVERKIRYDKTIVEYQCQWLAREAKQAVLFHRIETPFQMLLDQYQLEIPEGTYTLAFYWEDRPYNVYFWRDCQGQYLGAYFNIVRNTEISDEAVSFEDLIIDVVVLPNGDYFVLDEDELPEALDTFENGIVAEALLALTSAVQHIMVQIQEEVERDYRHEMFTE